MANTTTPTEARTSIVELVIDGRDALQQILDGRVRLLADLKELQKAPLCLSSLVFGMAISNESELLLEAATDGDFDHLGEAKLDEFSDFFRMCDMLLAEEARTADDDDA